MELGRKKIGGIILGREEGEHDGNIRRNLKKENNTKLQLRLAHKRSTTTFREPLFFNYTCAVEKIRSCGVAATPGRPASSLRGKCNHTS